MFRLRANRRVRRRLLPGRLCARLPGAVGGLDRLGQPLPAFSECMATPRRSLRYAQFLGLRVAMASVAHPRPGIARYRDVELSDVETGKSVASCNQVEYRTSAVDGSVKVTHWHGVTIERGGLPPVATRNFCSALLRHDREASQRRSLNLTLTADRYHDRGCHRYIPNSVLRSGRQRSHQRPGLRSFTPSSWTHAAMAIRPRPKNEKIGQGPHPAAFCAQSS